MLPVNIPTFTVSSSFIWIPLALLAVIAGVHIAIFLYHWNTYNIAKGNLGKLTILVYLSGLIFFLTLSLLATLAYVA